MIKVGDSFIRFAEYVKKSLHKFEHQLTLLSMKNGNIDLMKISEMLIKKENLSGLNGEFQLCDPTELLKNHMTTIDLEGIQEAADEENDETKREGEDGENGEDKETED